MNDADLVDLINKAVEVAVDRAQRSIVQPQFLVGTLLEVNASGFNVHEVLIDGDDEEVAAMDVSGITWVSPPNPLSPTDRDVPGARVAIVFAPPHQFWIIGYLRQE